MSLRYAGHLPVCIPYMIVHSFKSIRQRIGSHLQHIADFVKVRLQLHALQC